MTDRIDHAEEAVTWLENAKRAQGSSEPYNEQLATAYAGIAQGHATLALVEQQRIANLIALADLNYKVGESEPYDPITWTDETDLRALQPRIKEGLGL